MLVLLSKDSVEKLMLEIIMLHWQKWIKKIQTST